MLPTIRHQDTGQYVVVAKLLTGYIKESHKIVDADAYIKVNGIYDAEFTAFVVSWQKNHGLSADGIIGPKTWAEIAKNAPTCSTGRNRISGYTFALQLLLGGNLTADAIYGERTKSAVAAYQSASGLVADGICGPKTWSSIIVGAQPAPGPSPEPGHFVQPVDYKQGAKPWGPWMYSNHNDPKQTMSNSGCGPTAAADVMATMVDKDIDPYDLAMMAVDWGDRSYNSGTNYSFFKHLADHYNFDKMIQTKSLDTLKACLNAGGYVVCSMGPGYWTTGGHYICGWKYDSEKIYANDPASSKRKSQNQSDFKAQSKQYFCFYPNAKPENNAGDVPVPVQKNTPRGIKIVDISKHQPNVDYNALIGDTSLIILRAGYRGEGTTGLNGKVKIDECFIQHAEALKEAGVRFGVYFYSIANTAAKAREEAQAFVEYAGRYNPLFWAGDFEKPEITTEGIGAFADAMRDLGYIDKIGAYVANEKYETPYHFDKVRDKYDFVWIPKYLKTAPVYPCDLWQYTSTGQVDGISRNVDLNRITGSGHPLEWFLGEPEPGKGD